MDNARELSVSASGKSVTITHCFQSCLPVLRAFYSKNPSTQAALPTEVVIPGGAGIDPTMAPRTLHIETPSVLSSPLTRLLGRDVYLKLENLQPCGSFKLRGIGLLCAEAAGRGCAEIVSSSGGNAGLAAAYSARQLGLRCSVYTPTTTPAMMLDLLRAEGATVHVVGKNWNEANVVAVERSRSPDCQFVHPFEDPTIWMGHATMVEELQKQLPEPPACIVVSVGGGGLAIGVIKGMERVGWSDVPLVAMETVGADCFSQALKAGAPVPLAGITSVAKSLGALQVSDTLLSLARQRPVVSAVVTDGQAVDACARFASDHRQLVEPACGAALAAAYSGRLSAELLRRPGPVVVVVCGGSAVTPQMLATWQTQLAE